MNNYNQLRNWFFVAKIIFIVSCAAVVVLTFCHGSTLLIAFSLVGIPVSLNVIVVTDERIKRMKQDELYAAIDRASELMQYGVGLHQTFAAIAKVQSKRL